MRLNIKALGAGALTGEKSFDFAFDLDLSQLDRWGEKPFPAPGKISGTLTNRLGILTLCYTAEFVMETVCARCLEPVRQDIRQQFSHMVMERDALDDRSAEYSDAYVPAYGGMVDMDALVAADILLSQEGVVLCGEDCQGLCPICAVNRNRETCTCESRQTDTRFGALPAYMEKEIEE